MAWVLIVAPWFAAGGCRTGDVIPEEGALLLRVLTDDVGKKPQQLHISVYDDTGPLWKNVRVPGEGDLALVGSGAEIGTVLIQPGPVEGDLRIHVRGLKGGARAADGTLNVPAEERARGKFDLTLRSADSADLDQDDVPDDIDDCPTTGNPDQRGCPGAGGAGGADGMLDGGVADGGTTGSAGAGGGRGAGGNGGELGGSNGAGGRGAGGGAGSGMGTGGTGTGASGTGGRGTGGSGTGGSGTGGRGTGGSAPGTGGTSPGGTGGSQQKRPNGAACSATLDCQSGFCVDGACCNTACNDACQSCSTGTCSPLRNRSDPPMCTGTRSCDNDGRCRNGF